MANAALNGSEKTLSGRRRITLNSASNRSTITNGRELLPGVDGRSAWVRRVKDLIALHASDLGGQDYMSEAKLSMIRRAAVLTSELEQLELKFALGEADTKLLETYQRMTNTLRRVLQTLGNERVARDAHLPLRERLINGAG
jgi:hypothetical protein